MRKKNIAVFSPVRPAVTGISDYTEELLPYLAEDFEIDLFLDGYEPENASTARTARCLGAADFDAMNNLRPYDLVVFHLGNSKYHNYIYPFLYRVPGLTVLHDYSLHLTRLRTALENWKGEEYRAEMKAAYGDAGATAAELALAGMHNRFLLRAFPLSELPVRAGLMTAVHEEWVAERIREKVPEAVVRTIPMGIELQEPLPETVTSVRRRYGIPDQAFVLGTFGLLTPEKQIPELLRSFRRLAERRPEAHCLLVGARGGDLPLDEIISELGIEDRVFVTGHLPMADFLAHMAACDLAAFLRWPTQRETSGVILRAMALGVPTMVSDLAHLHGLPDDAVVKIPVVDSDRFLRNALLELVDNEPRRHRFGAAARQFFRLNHSWNRVRRRWSEIISEATELAVSVEIDKGFLPPHLQAG